MATMTLQTDNLSVFNHLKKVIELMKGVSILKIDRKSNAITEDEIPNATTKAAMKEAESDKDAGVVSTDSLQSFIDSFE